VFLIKLLLLFSDRIKLFFYLPGCFGNGDDKIKNEFEKKIKQEAQQ
jgi:hypothetical protein